MYVWKSKLGPIKKSISRLELVEAQELRLARKVPAHDDHGVLGHTKLASLRLEARRLGLPHVQTVVHLSTWPLSC